MGRLRALGKGEIMFCPKCHYEYEIGITECPDCGIKLVAELPPDDEIDYTELVTVFTTGDAGLFMLAKSILEDAGIDYYAKGEKTKELFAAGFMELQVHPDYADEAIKLIDDMAKGNYVTDEDELDEDEEEEEER
ncbi:conserved hypothetical protein [Candidatus Zixiibacteriota bacterium]|nr:conserved hypothetical protein [candidate division Zixibacteria bacterium]